MLVVILMILLLLLIIDFVVCSCGVVAADVAASASA